MRVALASGFLLLSALYTIPAVHALSRPQMDRALSGSSSVIPVASKKCLGIYNRCVAKCKKDTSCKDGCVIDRDLCNIFGPYY
jgi:hypothetical protein